MSSDEPETTSPQRESDVLDRMPEVPAPTEATPPPETLRDVFDEAQAMWRREFEAAGAGYTPAPLTILPGSIGSPTFEVDKMMSHFSSRARLSTTCRVRNRRRR